MMEERYTTAVEAFERKDFVEALKLFSQMEDEDSKRYENQCVEALEDILYYSNRKQAQSLLKRLEFYKDYSYFVDARNRKKMDVIAKTMMFGCAILGTILLILFCIK